MVAVRIISDIMLLLESTTRPLSSAKLDHAESECVLCIERSFFFTISDRSFGIGNCAWETKPVKFEPCKMSNHDAAYRRICKNGAGKRTRDSSRLLFTIWGI